MRRMLVALLVAALALPSCKSSGGDALLIGRLFGDESVGCVWIGRPNGGLEVEWPSLYDVDIDRVRISGPGFLAEEGDWFRMQGGTRPDVPVTPGCPVPEPESGKFVPGGIDYFGDVRPPSEFGST